ncbi:unnamed protein product [Boreogadus saida]
MHARTQKKKEPMFNDISSNVPWLSIHRLKDEGEKAQSTGGDTSSFRHAGGLQGTVPTASRWRHARREGGDVRAGVGRPVAKRGGRGRAGDPQVLPGRGSATVSVVSVEPPRDVMEEMDNKPYQPLSKGRHEMEMSYTSSSDESEDGRAAHQRSYASRETLPDYAHELRLTLGSAHRERQTGYNQHPPASRYPARPAHQANKPH